MIDAAPGRALSAVDWAIVLLFVGACFWLSRRRSSDSKREYFVGDRSYSSLTIGISMFVTLFSSISFLSGPGEVVRNGIGVFLGQLIALPIVYPILGYLIVPALVKAQKVSLYELLGERLGHNIRVVSAVMFIVYRSIWMAVLMHFASVALTVALGWDNALVPLVTISTGIITAIYATMGGIRGVLLTDVLQFYVLTLGILATIAVITYHFAGVSWIGMAGSLNWDPQPFFSLDPTVRLTLVGAALRSMMLDLAHGVDQTQVQRYVASADVKQARRAILIRLWGSIFVWSILVLLGLALAAFYQQFGQLPAGESMKGYADRILPHFIANYLPIGIAGLLVASVLAAAMSSMSSGVNSFSVVIVNDLMRRKPEGEAAARSTRLAMVVAISVGVGITVLSLLVNAVPGNFIEVTSRTFQLLIPLELGIVLMALFVKRANSPGVIWGIVFGLTFGIVFSYWAQITGGKSFSFTLNMPVILVIQFVTSYLVSLLFQRVTTRRVSLHLALLATLVVSVALVCRL